MKQKKAPKINLKVSLEGLHLLHKGESIIPSKVFDECLEAARNFRPNPTGALRNYIIQLSTPKKKEFVKEKVIFT